jgi:hypothetical protein
VRTNRRKSPVLPLTLLALGTLGWQAYRSFERAGAGAQQPAARAEAPRAQRDGAWLMAPVQVSQAPVPAAFSAPLPLLSRGEAWTEAHPPHAHVQDALCAGDAQMGERLATAVAAGLAAGASADATLASFGAFVEGCEPRACAWWKEAALDAARPAAMREVAWYALAGCPREDVASLFARDDVPAFALVRHLGRFQPGAPPTPYAPRLERAVHEVLQRPAAAPTWGTLRRAALLLGATDDARASAALLKLHAAAKAPEQKEALALALHRQTLPAARATFSAQCARTRDVLCQGAADVGSPAESEETGEVVADLVSGRLGAGTWARREAVPAEERMAKLEACAQAQAQHTGLREGCLQALSGLSAERAAALAQALAAGEDAREMRPMLQALAAAAKPGGLAARLDALGLTAVPGRAMALGEGDAQPFTAGEHLLARGRAVAFDAETGVFPNAHDHLLRELAALAPGALDGFVFQEVPPAEGDEAQGGGGYRLLAWGGGKRYEAAAANLGDWYDLEATLGFLNAIARERGSDVRWMALATGDQMAHVAAGPAAALSALVAEGLLDAGEADEARTSGRLVEQQVIDALKDEGE